MAEIYQLPENSGNGGLGNIPFSIPIGGFGMGNGFGFGGGFGYGMNGIADLFGLAIIASMFGWNGGGFGGGFGGGNNGAAFLANQLNNDSGRELLMNAITSQGEAGRSATQNLATTLGQDFDLVNAAVQNVQNALQSLALQQAVSVPQIINSIQSGNQSLAQQLCQCCCEQRQQTMAQGYENQIRTIEQTNTLGSQADRNAAGLASAIADLKATTIDQFCALERRELQDKLDAARAENTQLKGDISQANQNQYFAGVVGQAIAPINAQLSQLNKEVDDIQCKMPQTVPVQWPQLTAVNTTPYVSGGFYPGYGFGGFGSYGGFGF